jgi:hypothetical protein
MIISHSKQFILLSPWKTASSTCHDSLAAYSESPYPRFFHFNPWLNRVVTQHLTLADLLALPEGKLDYRRAAFVRNPYDRAYSGFLQLQRDFSDQPKVGIDPGWITQLVRSQISRNMARVIAAGFDFDDWIALVPEYEIHEAGHNTNMVLHPCHYWTHINGVQQVGFIGRVEQFDADFADFCAFVGVEMPVIKAANISIDHQPALSIGGSRYVGKMSRRSIDRINDLFASDFDHFGHEMI